MLALGPTILSLVSFFPEPKFFLLQIISIDMLECHASGISPRLGSMLYRGDKGLREAPSWVC